MKYIRYEDKDKTEKYGVLEGEGINEIEWDLFGDYMPTDNTHNINEIKILPPGRYNFNRDSIGNWPYEKG